MNSTTSSREVLPLSIHIHTQTRARANILVGCDSDCVMINWQSMSYAREDTCPSPDGGVVDGWWGWSCHCENIALITVWISESFSGDDDSMRSQIAMCRLGWEKSSNKPNWNTICYSVPIPSCFGICRKSENPSVKSHPSNDLSWSQKKSFSSPSSQPDGRKVSKAEPVCTL